MRKFLVVLNSVWIWTECAVFVLVWAGLLTVIRAFDKDPAKRRTARWFRRLGRIVAKVHPWRLSISGMEHVDPSKRYVVVSNHQSLADIPVVTHVKLDTKFLVKAELFKVPLFGYMLGLSGDIPVDRADRRKAATAMLSAARYLQQGCSIVAFPEGTRSMDGEVLAFHEGPFQLALREGVPVLPVVIEGSGQALPKDSWLIESKHEISLRVLEPVSVEGFGPKESGALRDLVRDRVIEELERLRGRVAEHRA